MLPCRRRTLPHHRRHVTTLLAAGIVLVGGCAENPTALPDGPSLSIADAAHAGNAHFYFLPSMVAQPHPSGTFDATLSPEVRVCAWDGSGCAVTLAVFTMDAGYGSETIRVSATDEHYVVNWHTEEILEQYPLGPGEVYRVRVLVDDHELGYADLAVVRRGRQLRGVDRDEFVPLKDGRTLAIKFRIEEGAVAAAEQAEEILGGVSAGRTHSCAVAGDGRAYCWGANHRGQLGTGVAGGTLETPQLVRGGMTWKAVQASRVYTCGLTTEGRMYCWGSNTLGELGIGTSDFTEHPTPEPVAGGHTFESLATLGNHNSSSSCGVTASGDMYCWGLNDRGQLGTGVVSNVEPTPLLVAGGYTFEGTVALGRSVACALTSAGETVCWGVNDFGQLGRGFTSSFSSPEPTPGPVAGGHSFSNVTVGATHACGIDGVGSAWCWGRNDDGELGIGTVGGGSSVPTMVTGGHAFARLNGGWGFTCGVSPIGEGLCWGVNQYGQLGRGFASGADQPTPGPVAGNLVFKEIAAGWRHACGITTTGETYCWGLGSSGQLGDGSSTNRSSPSLAIDLDPGS